jgi:small subunit ribosomal protein S24e
LDTSGKVPKSVVSAIAGPSSVHELQATLSDGETVVGYDRAHQFIDFYCRRYGFGKEEVTSETSAKKHGTDWESIMTVGGRRIGIGKAATKKLAVQSCYVDVTQYLEKCDPDLWKTFVEAEKTGKDLGLAPKVFCQISGSLEREINDLCSDVRKSTLYRKARASSASDIVPRSSASASAARLAPRRPLPHFLHEKSQRLMERRKEFFTDPRMAAMRATRAQLPVTMRSSEMLKHIQENEVTICMAATGSGKTTQIPQLILDDWIERGEGAKCNVICTQPRRIAAISVAGRVAKERDEVLGKSIGYQVRFESKVPEDHGSVTFCTTGIFLKRMQSALLNGSTPMGRSLDDVTHIVVDEVHERDVDTDLLLVVLKRLLADRKAKNNPIKVILMSATIDPSLFQNYFPDDQGRPAQVIEIPGRAFPVQKHFLDEFLPQLTQYREASFVLAQEPVVKYLLNELDPTMLQSLRLPTIRGSPVPDGRENKSDDLELPYPLIALTISHVLRTSDSGHVLVFLPGWEDIMSVQRSLLDRTQSLGLNFQDRQKWSIHLLHSTIPVAEQQQIFEPPPEGVRRVILATNIAETSITIPDVVYVIDTGKIKEQRFDPERHISSLVSAWVGSSNLNQRAGRAGRHRPGQYFGILGQRRASELHAYQTVEMKRVDLSNIVMHVKALNFPGMSVEEVLAATIEPPAAERVAAAIKDLQMVGALDAHKNLTSLGRVLLQLPLEVQIGRLVLFGSFFKCLDQALTLAAILTNRDPFVSPMHLKTEAARVKNSWTSSDFRSDTLAILQAYNAWWSLQGNGEYMSANRFCSDNFLAKPTLLTIQKIKTHLLQSLHHAGVLDVSTGNHIEVERTVGRRKDIPIPPELNANGGSMPLLVALIAMASQPKFAIRTGERVYRTAKDKVCVRTSGDTPSFDRPSRSHLFILRALTIADEKNATQRKSIL